MLVRALLYTVVVFLMSLPLVQAAKADVSIAVVDVQRLLTESEAALSIQKQVQAEREKLQNEFAGYEQKLRDSEKQLVETRGDMSPEEFSSKREEFQIELQETGSLVQKKKRALENGLVKATGSCAVRF